MHKDLDCCELIEELKRVSYRLQGIEKRISQIERHKFFAEYRPLPAWMHNIVEKIDAWLKQRNLQ
jgi:hypothetical protein